MHDRQVKTTRIPAFWTYLAAFLLCPPLALAHLCDNVYRQKDKVIIKPEFTNLIMKDKCEYRVFIQNNMDRGVETAGLDATSEAFDIQIKPHAMPIPKAKSEKDRVAFDVAMSLKPGYSSGSYRVNFKLVGRGKEGAGREIASYAIQTGDQTPFYIAPQALTVRENRNASPRIDGALTDACWRGAASFTNFLIEDGSHAHQQSVGLAVSDGRHLYLALALSDPEPGSLVPGTDRVIVVIRRRQGKAHLIEMDSKGKAKAWIAGDDGRKEPAASLPVSSAGRPDPERQLWNVEVSIPLKDLGAGSGDWQINVIRYSRNPDERASSWAGLPSSAEKFQSFGTLRIKSAREE